MRVPPLPVMTSLPPRPSNELKLLRNPPGLLPLRNEPTLKVSTKFEPVNCSTSSSVSKPTEASPLTVPVELLKPGKPPRLIDTPALALE